MTTTRRSSSRRKEGDSAPRDGEALTSALRLLSVRARSRHEVTVLLERRRFLPAEQAAALARLDELGYLDDGRFARERALSLLRAGKFGPQAVLQRLKAHGLPDELARQALELAQAEVSFDPLAAARTVLERRELLNRSLSLPERAKAARLLRSRGFSGDVVEAILGNAELDPGTDGD